MGKYCIDANVLITAWNVHYPQENFPTLWDNLVLLKDELCIIEPIYNEIEPINSEDKKLSESDKKEKFPIKMWLIDNELKSAPIEDIIDIKSLEMEEEYKITEDPRGAGQIDITLISYAKHYNKTVVTYEGVQLQEPPHTSRFKIPLICKKEFVDCISFVEMIQKLNIII